MGRLDDFVLGRERGMKAIITVGISASGKSTWAREYALKHNAVITNRDDLRFSLTGAKDWSEYKFSDVIESFITTAQRQVVTFASGLNRDIVIADTNLDRPRRYIWMRFCADLGFDIELKPFDIELDDAIARDSERERSVGKDVITKQYKQWLKFKQGEV